MEGFNPLFCGIFGLKWLFLPPLMLILFLDIVVVFGVILAIITDPFRRSRYKIISDENEDENVSNHKEKPRLFNEPKFFDNWPYEHLMFLWLFLFFGCCCLFLWGLLEYIPNTYTSSCKIW